MADSRRDSRPTGVRRCTEANCDLPVFPTGLTDLTTRHRFCVRHVCRFGDCDERNLGGAADWVCREHLAAWQADRRMAAARFESLYADQIFERPPRRGRTGRPPTRNRVAPGGH